MLKCPYGNLAIKLLNMNWPQIVTGYIRRPKMNELMLIERIANRIYLLRDQKVMLDFDLADLYQIENKQLKRQVRRNIDRFPPDFMFVLDQKEFDRLRCQNGTLKRGEHPKYYPYAFTEQGVAMLSSIISSKRAIEVNIMIMRAFVKLRQVLSDNKDLTYLFRELKGKVDRHDAEIGQIIKAIEKMIAYEKKPKAKIGFAP
jgi:ORF6N domain